MYIVVKNYSRKYNLEEMIMSIKEEIHGLTDESTDKSRKTGCN